MKLLDAYFNLSIKYKMLSLFFCFTILISAVLGIYAYSVSENYIINKVGAVNLGVVKQIDANLSNLQKNLFDISTFICVDPDVKNYLNKSPEDLIDMPESMVYNLNNPLTRSLSITTYNDYISCIILYNRYGTPIYFSSNDSSVGTSPITSAKEKEIVGKALDLKGKALWVPISKETPVFIEKNSSPKYAMCRSIIDAYTYDVIGFMVLCVNQQTFTKMYQGNLQSNRDSIIMLGKNNEVISSTGPAFSSALNQSRLVQVLQTNGNQLEGYVVDHTLGENLLISYSNTNLDSWQVVFAVPIKTLTREINSIKSFTVIVILLCLVLSLPLMFLLSTLLISPLKKLLKSMKNFQQGNFDERVRIRHHDEIGQLGAGFNNMVSEIKKLISEVYISQIKEREAELNALQAQINPHFLYNTLDTILHKAESYGQTEIADMVFSLSRMFRLSLNRGKNFTLVSKEKELIEHYLLLQKIRFKNKLNYEIFIVDEVLDYVIPKLILQPFVENAVLHGIEAINANGRITISGSLQGDFIGFVVEDNGKGMEQEKLDGLLISDGTEDVDLSSVKAGGYAVKNVNERLEIAYGKNYTLEIFSKPGKGTRVEIILPVTGVKESEAEL